MWIDDAVVLAVSGLVIKETATMIIKLKTKKNGNGKNNLKGLLEDIRATG